MNSFLEIVYNILGIPLFRIALFFLLPFNKKVRKGIKSRKEFPERMISDLKALDPNKTNILFQCSSLGEFEQAKPVAKELDNFKIFNFIFSFFSPSGYDHADFSFLTESKYIKTYLPLDIRNHAKLFIDLIKPKAAIFIKYDLWYNLLNYINKNNIYTLLINATFDNNKFRYKLPLLKTLYKKLYSMFDCIFTIDKDNKNKLMEFIDSSENIQVSGDTKLERINDAFESNRTRKMLDDKITEGKVIFVIGSSWEHDMELILPAIDRLCMNGIKNNFLTIVAPHDPSINNILNIENEINEKYKNLNYIRFSDIKKYKSQNLIIIDCIGILLTLYKYADIAYVGGSFNHGLHNVMEPARFNIPVLFGDERISEDAQYLLQKGIGVKISNKKDIYYNLLKVTNDKVSDMSYEVSSIFLNNHKSSKIIADKIIKHISHVQ